MAEVEILVEGYASADPSGGRYCPTITLVKSRGMRIIVDPGTVQNQQIIVQGLSDQGLELDDVDVVFITHSHLDHYRNLGMFPRAKVLEFWGVWDGDRCTDWQEQLTDEVRIVRTPGHSHDSLTLLVKTGRGAVAVCGDVFWKRDYPEEDPYAEDAVQLKKTREHVLQLAEYVIPGHGDMWKVGEARDTLTEPGVSRA